MKRLIIILLTAWNLCGVAASHTGRVFLDKNGNQLYDKDEKGLAGISVTDGLNVVQTDNDGCFTLPGHSDERFVYLTLPAGYRSECFYQRISEGQSRYDFALQPANPKSVKADGSHRFIHFSDTHMYDSYLTAADGYARSAKYVRDYVANEDIAFVIHTGDIAKEGFATYKEMLNNENLPDAQMFYAIGNHDLAKGSYGEELYEKYFGPAYYSFEVGNTHYIVTPMARGDARPNYTNESIGRWLKNDLKQVAPNKPIIAFNHSVMSGDGHFRFGSEKEGFIDLADYNLKAWFYGHWHHDRMYHYDNSDVLMVCSPGHVRGSYDHSPSSFRVMNCGSEGELSSEIRYPYIDKAVTIASIDNGHPAVTPEGKVQLSVNTYSSISPTRTVTYSYSSGRKEYKKNLPLIQRTDFNWYTEVELPSSLDGQLVSINVTATFANGEVAQEQAVFRYEKTPVRNVAIGDDWTNLLQTATHVANIKDTLQLPLQLAWVQNVGANIYFTSPLVYKENIYIASLDDNGKGRASVTAMDATTGQIRWQYPLRHTVRSSIAAESGLIFAQDINGWLYAIDATTGKLRWEKDLKMNKQVPLDDGLATADGIVYAGTGRSLCAFYAQTGELIWQNKDWDTGHGTSATITVGNGIVVTHAFWEATHANDAQTGRKLWSRGFGFGGTMAIHDGLLYCLSNRSLSIRDAKSGRTIIEKQYDFELKNLSTPLITPQEIIFGTAENGVVAVDASTLEVKWRFRTGQAMIYTVPTLGDPASPVEGSPVFSGDVVYIGASDGYLYGLERKSGQLLWKHKMGAPILGTVAISGNALFVADFSGNIYGFVSKLK